MEQKKQLCVGLDLGNEYSQISCFHPRTGELETIGNKTTDAFFLIPTCVLAGKRRHEWMFGREAFDNQEQEGTFFFDNLLGKEEIECQIWNERVTKVDVLTIFLKKTLMLLSKYYPEPFIKRLVVTMESEEEVLKQLVYQALHNLGIEEDRAFVESYTESFEYYALSQKQELWSREIGLFDFNRRGCVFKQIHINRNCQPYALYCETTDLSHLISYEMLTEKKEGEVAELFFEVASKQLFDQDIATLYFTGEGFLSKWSDTVLTKLCMGRRGFRGPNIYTRGAAYHAKDFSEGEFLRRFLILSKGIFEQTIAMRVYKDGKSKEMELIPAGIPWKEAYAKVCVILDQEQELRFMIRNYKTATSCERIISLESIPNRPNRMNRFHIEVSLEDVKTCKIKVKDVGFGEYAPSTDRMWEKRLEL